MDTKRQKTRFRQLELAFPRQGGDEVPQAAEERVEVLMAKQDSERPAPDERLMEEVCERENLKKALTRLSRFKN